MRLFDNHLDLLTYLVCNRDYSFEECITIISRYFRHDISQAKTYRLYAQFVAMTKE